MIDTALTFRVKLGIALEGGRWFFREIEFQAQFDSSLDDLRTIVQDRLHSVVGQHESVVYFWVHEYQVIS